MSYFFNFEKLTYVQGERYEDCILCGLNKDDPALVNLSVYRDPLFNISVNLYPYNPAHLILFPLRHIEDIREYTDEESLRIFQLVKGLLTVLDNLYRPHGYNVGYNMGLVSGASIKHLHLHIIPRYPAEVGIAELVGGKRVLVENPFETAERIKKELNQKPFSIF